MQRYSDRSRPFHTQSLNGQKQRALFYSHDTLGMGHLRRSLLLSEQLGAEFGDLTSLIVTGSGVPQCFVVPDGTDYVKLPSVTKIDNEHYEPRSLSISIEETLRLREELILNVTANFKPDFLFVDNVPLGMRGEMRKTLEYVRMRMPSTKVFLNLRDILDDSRHIIPLWRQLNVFDILHRFYDRIFVYGSPRIYNLPDEYALPESIRRKVRFCGYIARDIDPDESMDIRRNLCPNGEELVFVTVGGGSDGAHLIRNYLEALPTIRRRREVTSYVVLGPEMAAQEASDLLAKSGRCENTTAVTFCDKSVAHINAADLIVSMAGYNTVTEILCLRKRAIVVPRTRPRTEQLIRARRLHELGLARMIHPGQLHRQRLAEQVASALDSPEPSDSGLEFCAAQRLACEILDVMDEMDKVQQLQSASAAVSMVAEAV